jgi:hypothetical protein
MVGMKMGTVMTMSQGETIHPMTMRMNEEGRGTGNELRVEAGVRIHSNISNFIRLRSMQASFISEWERLKKPNSSPFHHME